MPDGIDYGDMMRQLDAEAVIEMHAAAAERRARLERMAAQLTRLSGVNVQAARGALWVRRTDWVALRRATPYAARETHDEMRQIGDVVIRGYSDAEAWKWDPESVAAARDIAHERLVQPRMQRRITAFVVRRTRASRDAARGGAS